MRKKVLAILGPTAAGKTDLAIKLASGWNGELVACDSRQVYKGLNLGTGKQATGMSQQAIVGKNYWEMDGVKVWLYDVADVKKQYSVFNYVKQAKKVIDDILDRRKLPIIVGGTGLYLKGLLKGIPNLQISIDKKLRRELNGLNLSQLQKKLQLLSPSVFEKLNNSDKQNSRRLLRAIEIVSMNPLSSDIRIRISDVGELDVRKYNVLKIGLMAPREILNKKIDERLVIRINQGMIDEVKNLRKNGISLNRLISLGLEYKYAAYFLAGLIDKEQLMEQLKVKIHQYAKRQMTWFRKQPDINWFDITDQNYLEKVERLVSDWYN